MAPRGRSRKKKETVGLTRKDAAIDAMLVMGFPRKLITQTITQLLKVYGGNEGWRFIEIDSYRALIEAILEKNDPEADECLKDDDIAGNSQRFSEAGSSSVPPPPVNDEVDATLPPADDGLDSESQTETVVNPPFAIPESECNVVTSPGEEREEVAAAGLLDQVSNLNNSMAPYVDEDPAQILSLVQCNAFTSPAEEPEVAGPPDPVTNLNNSPSFDEHPAPFLSMAEVCTSPAEENQVPGPPGPVSSLNNSMAPCLDEHPAPTLPVAECKVFTSPAEQSQAPGPPDPVTILNDSIMAPCFDEHPGPVLSSMSRKRSRPPCHGILPRRMNGDYDEPTNFVVLEHSPFPEDVLKLLGRDIPRPRKRMWDVRP